MAATGALADGVRRVVAPRLVYGNGIGDGAAYFGGPAPRSALAGSLDGAVLETFGRDAGDPIGQYRSLADWKADVDVLVDLDRRGVRALTITKTWVPATTTQVNDWRQYALGTFLLGAGEGARFSFVSAAGLETPSEDSWILHVPLGSPVGGYRPADGVYQRDFANGRVLVNPGTGPVRVALGETLHTPSCTAVTAVTVPAHSARLLPRDCG